MRTLVTAWTRALVLASGSSVFFVRGAWEPAVAKPAVTAMDPPSPKYTRLKTDSALCAAASRADAVLF